MIKFNKELHTYQMLKNGEFISLLNFSTFVKKYIREFDAFAISGKLAQKGGNQKDIMKGWNVKGRISREYGTTLHSTLEGYIKYNIIPDDLYLTYFLGKFEKLLHELDVKKEDLQSELLIGNEELEIGGIIDISHEKYNFDLKTGSFEKKKKGNLKKPFDFIENSPIGKATMQLNFYSLFDENDGKDLKVIYWNGQYFKIIDIDKFTDEQKELLISEIKNYGRNNQARKVNR